MQFFKILKVFVINLIILGTLFVCIEYLSYKKLCYLFNDSTSKFILFTHASNSKHFSEHMEWKYKNPDLIDGGHSFINFKTNSNIGIIVTGCSMAYGVSMNAKNNRLENSQTFSYKLSKQLNYNVYNRAVACGGLNEFFYLIKKSLFYDDIEVHPKYILYFYQHDQLRRMIMRCSPSNNLFGGMFYKNIDGNLISKKIPFLESLYTYNLIIKELVDSNNYYIKQYMQDLFKVYLKCINKELKEKFPDTKFIIVKFTNHYDFEDEILSDYNVINIPQITGIDIMLNNKATKKYLADDCFHPNELYWDTVLPSIIKELKKF